MAELITVARPYAEAAFRAGREASDLAGFSNQLQLAAAIAQDDQMASLLASPKLGSVEKRELFYSVAGAKLTGTVKHLVELLIDNQRVVLLPLISEQFDALKNAEEGVLKARIVSAFTLDAGQIASIVDALASKHGRKVEAEVSVDPSLIGGANIEIGDEVIHGSVRDALAKMRVALTH